MTLDDATRQVYRRTDSATLLALLPELRRLSKRTHKEMGLVEQTLRDRDVSVQPETSNDPHERHPTVGATPGDGAIACTGHDETFAAHLFGYATDIGERERWISGELKRRSLIPLWPGEQAYLQEDA